MGMASILIDSSISWDPSSLDESSSPGLFDISPVTEEAVSCLIDKSFAFRIKGRKRTSLHLRNGNSFYLLLSHIPLPCLNVPFVKG